MFKLKKNTEQEKYELRKKRIESISFKSYELPLMIILFVLSGLFYDLNLNIAFRVCEFFAIGEFMWMFCSIIDLFICNILIKRYEEKFLSIGKGDDK